MRARSILTAGSHVLFIMEPGTRLTAAALMAALPPPPMIVEHQPIFAATNTLCESLRYILKKDLDGQAEEAWTREEFAAFIATLAPVREVVRFLATAINVLKRGRIIFQPRWKAGRWKAKT